MNIELGKLANGGVVLVCDRALPHMVRRVDYYREQNLLVLVYDQPDELDDLLEYEVPPGGTPSLRAQTTILIVDRATNGAMQGYDVALART